MANDRPHDAARSGSVREGMHSVWALRLAPPVALILLFALVYGRTAPSLFFVMDDFIHAQREIHADLWQALSGVVSWSGYRPLATLMRIGMVRTFGTEWMLSYYIVMLGMHLANVLLVYALVRRVSADVKWSFVAAAIMLLLPAHNEAVLWFGANASELSFLFAILALHGALSYRNGGSRWFIATTIVCYALSVLAFEVMIVLPILIALADLMIARDWQRVAYRWRFYLTLAVIGVALLGVRLLVAEGALLPQRPDYRFSTSPLTLLHGYGAILMQLLLLATSPAPGALGYVNTREWLSPIMPEAILAILLAVGSTAVVFYLAERRGAHAPITAEVGPQSTRLDQRDRLGWSAWGVTWVILVGLPFAGLAGRNPENRYMYILGFGLAIAVAASLSALWHVWAEKAVRRDYLFGAVALLLGFYAYVSASDGWEWMRAGEHTRAHFKGVGAMLPDGLPAGSSIITIGMPSSVGSAYTYTLDEAYRASLDLQFGARPERGIIGDWEVRDRFAEAPLATTWYAFHYSPLERRLIPISTLRFCQNGGDCYDANLGMTTEMTERPSMRYLQMQNDAHPEWGTVMWIGHASERVMWGCGVLPPSGSGTPTGQETAAPSLEERCAEAMARAYD